MNKKANAVYALALFIVIIIAFGIISVYSYTIFADIKGDILSDLTLNESKQVINDTNTRLPQWSDGAIALILVGLWLAGIVSVITVDEHPIIFGLMMFVLLFVIIAGAMLGNAWEEIFQDSEFTGVSTTFPITYWVCTHMLELSIVVAASILLAMMAKNRL